MTDPSPRDGALPLESDAAGGPSGAPEGPAPEAAPQEADRDQELRRPRAPKPPPDKYAIGALVTSLLALFPVAVVLGHIALARIRVFGVGGRGLAVAALVIGYVGLVVGLAAWTLYFAVVAPEVTLP
ncbi:MAG TPA: DUF4190 domain-containing protein [Naasia sp.]